MTTTLTFCALFTGLLHIRAEYQGPRWHCYLFKPLTMTLILLLAWQIGQPVTPFYQILIMVGLGFSLLGDIFLVLPKDRFIHGLVSFLIAHLFYIVAFASQSNTLLVWWVLPVFALYGCGILLFLWHHLARLKIPVLFYMAVILLMGWQSYGQWQNGEQSRALWALWGASLFIISDSILAVDHFRQPFKAAQALVLGTYYVAQMLIAWSVAG